MTQSSLTMCPVALGALILACAGQLCGQPADLARRIIERNCLGCHGQAQMSGLDLRSRETMLRGGKRGAAITPGNADASLLYRAVSGVGELKMPPGKQSLPAEDIQSL